MTEPDYPYPKQPNPAEAPTSPPPMPPPEPSPPSPPPMSSPAPRKFTCQVCGKVFNSKEELTLHIETVHGSPKKKA
ncbi:MAG: C2H2-type zinc finger protein [Candidatus Bathyarchaeia archaeon]